MMDAAHRSAPPPHRKAIRGRQTSLILLCMALALGCAAHSVRPSVRRAVVGRSQLLMGTVVQVTAVATSDEVASVAAAAALDEVARLEALLSTWLHDSELSRINANAGYAPVRVGTETLYLLKRALELGELTDGAFNIAVGPAIDAWSFGDQPRVPSDAELAALLPLLNRNAVRVDEGTGTVSLTRPAMRLDVGGIGKGFAADRAVAAMRAAGATAGVVALSGDLKTFGRRPDGRKFVLGIRHPRRDGAVIARVELQDQAVSTAGDYQHYFERNGVRYHHILDPRTLQPSRACQSVTVVADEGIDADGLDTAIFVLGPGPGMALAERLPGIEAVIVDAAGNLLVSSGLTDRLHLESPPE